MNTNVLVNMFANGIVRQGTGISKDEWRLQRRSWGTWLVGLFFFAVVLSEHPVLSGYALTAVDNAAYWADRASLVGSLVALLTVPFALDRVRRQQAATIEFSKPFEKLAYVLGKFTGAVLPLIIFTLVSMMIHGFLTVVRVAEVGMMETAVSYLNQALLIVFPPLFFAVAVTYCLSVFIRRPIVIIPLYLCYLMLTAVTQVAADAQFSWISPVVRPEYFDGAIPPAWMPTVLAHQIVYVLLAMVALALAVYGFERERFLDASVKRRFWQRLRLPVLSGLGVRARLLWGGHIVAALLMAFMAFINSTSNPDTNVYAWADYALFGLEFYLPLCALLILAGVLARDKGSGMLDLVLTKPVNRWRLLWDRLLPGLMLYSFVMVVSVALLQLISGAMPIGKALLVSFSTGVYLGMIGLTVANITRNALAGYGAGILFWFFEAGFNGRLTAPFYLFIVSQQVSGVSSEAWWEPMIWLPVKIGVLLLSVWLFVLNGWLLDVGRTRRRAIVVLVLSVLILYVLGWWLVPLFV